MALEDTEIIEDQIIVAREDMVDEEQKDHEEN